MLDFNPLSSPLTLNPNLNPPEASKPRLPASATTFREMIGNLPYLADGARPNTASAAALLCGTVAKGWSVSHFAGPVKIRGFSVCKPIRRYDLWSYMPIVHTTDIVR